MLTLYRNKFVDTVNDERQICRADEYFDISIGKTPPRKEPQWFSTNSQDIDWVSISDMGTCGLYISNSSEQLTKEAVERHNVKVVPDNTVLLSFKLTVGRIAITNGEMTTNEAIAHFKTDKKEITIDNVFDTSLSGDKKTVADDIISTSGYKDLAEFKKALGSDAGSAVATVKVVFDATNHKVTTSVTYGKGADNKDINPKYKIKDVEATL